MSYTSMTSRIYKFDESEFIRRFISDYYTETDFDLESSFKEYFRNFVQSNSADYNSYVFVELYVVEYKNGKIGDFSFDYFLYEKLYSIIKVAMKV
jgi:hypothetical protein